MIKITQQESFYVRQHFPTVHITGVNKEHLSRAKGYYMTVEKNALKAICDLNSYARKELIEILEVELQRCNKKDEKKIKRIKQEIKELDW